MSLFSIEPIGGKLSKNGFPGQFQPAGFFIAALLSAPRLTRFPRMIQTHRLWVWREQELVSCDMKHAKIGCI
jgi:hypothetical protein